MQKVEGSSPFIRFWARLMRSGVPAGPLRPRALDEARLLSEFFAEI